ncbi:MAG: hypothetical protein BGP09_24985 [Rhizobium sp. 60-20]|jgi:hypothetical protein|nr:MAG: hypothetical protein BGP09_24985 [Rhizobium sp. 60-20]
MTGNGIYGMRKPLSHLCRVAILSMVLAGCSKPQPPATMPQPFAGSMLFREELACDPAINAAMVDLMEVLRKEFGPVSIERYRMPPDIDFRRIADHYRQQLPDDWEAAAYPPDHAAYRMIAWNSRGWTHRSLALAMLNEVGCPERLPYKILLVISPTEE